MPYAAILMTWPLLGLPRIMSTEEDYKWLVKAHQAKQMVSRFVRALWSNFQNDIPGMISRLGKHTFFS